MSAPIGKQIRAMLSASERIGYPAPAGVLAASVSLDLIPTTCTRICRRAVEYGLMTVDETKPLTFQAVEDWRDKLTRPISRRYPATPKAMPKRIINSVWSLA